jgi:hypothetical protein
MPLSAILGCKGNQVVTRQRRQTRGPRRKRTSARMERFFREREQPHPNALHADGKATPAAPHQVSPVASMPETPRPPVGRSVSVCPWALASSGVSAVALRLRFLRVRRQEGRPRKTTPRPKPGCVKFRFPMEAGPPPETDSQSLMLSISCGIRPHLPLVATS